jgi:hypothetical protein
LDADRPGSHGTRCPQRGCARTTPPLTDRPLNRPTPHPPVRLAVTPRRGSRPAVPPAGASRGSAPGRPNRSQKYIIAMPGMPVRVHPPAAPLTPS